MGEDRKKAIVDKARQLFNERGYNNTSIGDIAQALGISKGNVTYYFKKKEAIVQAILESNKNTRTKQPPRTLGELNDFFQDIQTTVENNAFYFWHHTQLGDIMPEIKIMQLKTFEENIGLLTGALTRLGDGNILIGQAYPGQYKRLVDSILLASIYWVPFHKIKEEDQENYLEQAWSLIYPFLTDQGRQELEKLFSFN